MIEFSNKHIEIFVIGIAIFTVLYLWLFSKKGKDKNIRGYIDALKSCIFYGVCSIFIIVGIGIVIQTIKQNSGIIGATIIFLGWLMIALIIVLKLIEKDFNKKFEFLSKIKVYIFKYIFKYISLIVPLLFPGLIFYAAYESRDNILQCITLILVGIILIIIEFSVYKFLHDIFNGKSKEKTINNINKEKFQISISQIIGVIFILFGIAFGLTIYMNINIKNKKEDTAIVVNIIDTHNDSESGDAYYFPVIEYWIDGRMYQKQINSISGKFNIGDNVKIIYNAENPNEVNIKISMAYFVFPVIFIAAGLFLIIKNKTSNKK